MDFLNGILDTGADTLMKGGEWLGQRTGKVYDFLGAGKTRAIANTGRRVLDELKRKAHDLAKASEISGFVGTGLTAAATWIGSTGIGAPIAALLAMGAGISANVSMGTALSAGGLSAIIGDYETAILKDEEYTRAMPKNGSYAGGSAPIGTIWAMPKNGERGSTLPSESSGSVDVSAASTLPSGRSTAASKGDGVIIRGNTSSRYATN